MIEYVAYPKLGSVNTEFRKEQDVIEQINYPMI